MTIPPFVAESAMKKFFENKDRNDKPLGKETCQESSQAKRTKHYLYGDVE